MTQKTLTAFRICNFGNLFVIQFIAKLLSFPFCNCKAMKTIFFMCNPFKVLNPIVRPVPINVIHKWFVQWVWNKSFSHKSVNSSFLSNVNVDIPTFVQVKFQKPAINASFSFAFTNFMRKASNISKGADLILFFKTSNVFPSFHKGCFGKYSKLSMKLKTLAA